MDKVSGISENSNLDSPKLQIFIPLSKGLTTQKQKNTKVFKGPHFLKNA